MRVPLDETVVITLNGSGAGTAKLGPISARETWYPDQASVKANSNPTNESACNIFKGIGATIDNYKDGTVNGSSGDATGKVTGRMQVGNYIFAVWSGGDANVQASLTVTGEKDV